MRKIIILMFLLLFINVLAYSKTTYFIDFTTNSLRPADGSYANIYGKSLLYPEIISGVKIFKGIYLYGGYGALSQEHYIEDAGNQAKVTSNQSFISFGLGYESYVSNSISLKVSGGISLVNYKEKAYLVDLLLEDDSGNNVGYKLDIGLFYNFYKNFNIGLIAGYFYTQNIEDFYRKLSFGGTKVGIVLGIKF